VSIFQYWQKLLLNIKTDLHSCATAPTSSPRQVHIIDSSLFSHLASPSSKYPSFALSPGSLGENITTDGLDLTSLSEGTRLHFGDHEGHAIVKVMGLRNPKKRLDEWPEGLLDRCKLKDKKGKTVGRTVGVMGVVEHEGYVQPGYTVYVEKPKHFRALGNV
jgi:MOSC domain-containing protein YiiM